MPDLKLVQDNTSTGNWTLSSTTSSSESFHRFTRDLAEQLKAAEKLLEESSAAKGADATVDVPVDVIKAPDHTLRMNDITREELSKTLSGIEDRMDKRVERMEKDTDRRSEEYRKEIALRDDTIRRELNLRRESFLAEQAIRDKAWEEKFSGFLQNQSERDKRLDESIVSIRDDLSRLGSLKLSIWGAMFTGLAITLTVIGLGLTSYQAGQADRRPADENQSPSIQPPPASQAK